MSSSPLSVRSVRRLMDGLVDEIAQATRAAAKRDAHLETQEGVIMELRGRYAIDESGELLFSGKASAQVVGAPLEIGAGVERSITDTGHGDGDLFVRLEVRMSVGGPLSPTAAEGEVG